MTKYIQLPSHRRRSFVTIILVCLLLQVTLAQTDLFISEYVEGSSNNKCIEIYNPTNNSINLGQYSLNFYNNGSSDPSFSFSLGGTIGPGATYVICHHLANANFLALADDIFFGIASFNGDDAVSLDKGNNRIDIFGNIGCQQVWTDGGLSTQDITLVRGACVNRGISSNPGGNCSFPTLSSEWFALDLDDASHLGEHVYLGPALTVNSTSPSDCGGSDGTLSIQASDANLLYSISGILGPFSTDPVFTGLSPGDYDIAVKVINDETCIVESNEVIVDRSPPVITDIDDEDPTDCGVEDGEIKITATGSSLEYSIDKGMTYQSSSTFSNLPADLFHIVVRVNGTNHCLVSETVSLQTPTRPNISSITPSPPSDCNATDGQITINATPSSFLQYSIDDGSNWSNSRVFNGLAAGDYHIVVRKSSAPSCQDEGFTTISDPEKPVLAIDHLMDANCKGKATGSISLNTIGGSGNYLYQWSGPTSIGNTSHPTGLTAGSYHVTVIDANAPACQDVLSDLQVIEPASDPPLPVLADLPSICQHDAALPLQTMQDGFSGTWSGPGVSDDNLFDPRGLVGPITLTFMPNPEQCATPNTTQIVVLLPVLPELDFFTPVCELAATVSLLPMQDGISGHWSGEGVMNDQFIPLGLSGPIALTFSPEPSQCALANETSIEVSKATSPTLQFISNLCENEQPVVLLADQMGISGSWSGPGVTNNHFNPSGLKGFITLVFKVDPDQCAVDGQKKLEIFEVVSPQLDAFPTFCENGLPYTLSDQQDKILGSWDGPGVNLNVFHPEGQTGPVSLTFIPNQDQCAEPVKKNLMIHKAPKITLDIRDPLCAEGKDGAMIAMISDGQEPYRIDWNLDGIGDFDDPTSIMNITSGNYQITVKDQNGCLMSDEGSLNDPTPLRASFTSNPATPGLHDGSVSLSVTGGSKPYQYLWGDGRSGSNLEDLAPGLYAVTVVDQHGCILTDQVVVGASHCDMTMEVKKREVSCFGGSDGLIEITVHSGVAPVSFLWAHDSLLEEKSADQLAPGSYQILVEDATGCRLDTTLIINQPDSLFTTLSPKGESFPGANDASLVATSYGGSPPLSYQWSNGATGSQLSDLSSGNYAVTTTDSLGCTHVEQVSIQPFDCEFELELKSQPASCSDRKDGRIEVVFQGGSSPFQYQWSHDSLLQDETATNLGPGIYSVSVREAEGCIDMKSISIDAPLPLAADIQSFDPTSANPAGGKISTVISGGTPPYQWLWSTGSTQANLEMLVTGDYSLTITDALNCQIIKSINLSIFSCDLEAIVIADSVSCAGENDGSAIIEMVSAQTPVKIKWSHDTTLHALVAERLMAGNYSVTLEDAIGCTLILTFEIKEPELLRIAYDAENETLPGAKNGYVSIYPIGGTPPYFYQWNTGQTTDSISDLKPGTYIVTLTDSRGCRSVRSMMINPANCILQSHVSAWAVNCFGETNGRARVDIATLAFPVDIQWSHDSTLTRNVVENLPVGTYSVTIIDGDQCSHTWPFIITQPDSLSIDLEVKHQSMAGVADGSIQLTAFGGTPDYHFAWSNGQRGPYVENLAPGNYTVTVVDEHGCATIDSTEVLSSDVCHLDLKILSRPSGCNTADGSIQAEPINARGEVDYQWSLPDLGSTWQADHLSAGVYWVEVSDEYCTIRDTIIIEVNDIRGVSYNLKQSLCDEGITTLDIGAVTGGNAPYNFFLDEISIRQNQPTLVSSGSHSLQITDAKGCHYQEEFNVIAGEFVTVPGDTLIKRGEDLNLKATIQGDLSRLHFLWRSREGVLCQQCLEIPIAPRETDVYIFEVTDENGCKFNRRVNVVVSEQNLVFIPNVYVLNQADENQAFTVFDGLGLIEEIISLEVFDRRGLKIYSAANFQSNEPAPNFADIMQNAIAPQVYMYVIHLRYRQGYEKRQMGDFVIIR